MPGAGCRDPKRFADPDTFNPERPDVEHLAPLARLETQIALVLPFWTCLVGIEILRTGIRPRT